MRTSHAAFVLFAVLAIGCSARHQNASTPPVPSDYLAKQVALRLCPALVLLEESNPWSGTAGPRLALYEDGTLIYWSEETKKFLQIKLSSHEVIEFLGRVELKGYAPRTRNSGFPPIYARSIPIASDAPEFRLSVRSLDGLTCRSIPPFVRALPEKKKKQQPPAIEPDPLPDILTFLPNYENANSEEWTPDFVLLEFYPQRIATSEPPIAWPQGWPDVRTATFADSEGTRLMLIERSLYLEMRPRLLRRKPMQPFEVEGKRWFVHAIYLFPHEAAYYQSFLSNPKKQ